MIDKRTGIWIKIAAAIVLTLGVIGFADFVIRWHHRGDLFATAEGQLLAFIASMVTALTTLVYVYFTQLALKEAQRANQLQFEQWKQRVTVTPKFWLSTGKMAVHQFPSADGKTFFKGAEYTLVNGTIWNYSEQSVLIHAIETQVAFSVWTRSFVLDVDKVIEAHKTHPIDFGNLLFAMLVDVDAPLPSAIVESIPKEKVEIRVRYSYTDWQSVNQWSAPVLTQAVVRTNWGTRGIQAVKIEIELQELAS